MIKKLFNKLIMGTESYVLLKHECKALEKENEKIRECSKIELAKTRKELTNLYTEIEHAKTNARRAVRAINKKDDELAKRLCNKIIKGEQ